MSDERKDLPPVTAPNFLERVRETLSTYLGNRGNGLDRGLILRDLAEAGIVDVSALYLAQRRGSPVAGAGVALQDAYQTDLMPPPTPTGFAVSAAISNILIEHAAPIYLQGHGHARTLVYGATWTSGPLPTFANAVKITEFAGTVFAHPTNPATTWHLWIKWESVDGVASSAPAGGTNGLVVTTGQDVAKMVTAMTGPGNPFTLLAVDTVIDGVTYPAGTYTTKALIFDAQISTAKIKNLAVDDAKIASLAVSKLTAGAVSVGQYIQSTGYMAGSAGWHINGNGNAEFSGVIVRGTVYATGGQIGGNSIDASGMQSPGYVAGVTGWRLSSSGALTAASGSFKGDITGASGTFGGNVHGGQFTTGAYTGYAWPAAGNYGSYLGPSGLLLGNANNNQYCQITYDGNIYTPGFSVVNGVMTVTQANVINTSNIAGNAVTISASAYTAGPTGGISSYTQIQSAALDAGGGSVFCTGTCFLSGGSGCTVYLEIRRDGSAIYSANTATLGGVGLSVTGAFTDTPAAGLHTYTLWIGSSGPLIYANGISLMCLGVKK